MKKLVFALSLTLLFNSLNAQYSTEEKNNETVHNQFGLGIGFGLNYGGIGMNLTYAPIKYISVTGHAGFNFIDFNAGIGLNAYILPRTKSYRPNLKVLYGYNAVIINIGLPSYNETYYGVTFGLGNEIRFGKKNAHGFDVDLLIPVRDEKFSDDFDAMKADPRVEVLSEPLPFAISVGYHFDF